MAIKYFGVENFRTFGANGKMAEFEFAPITILTGTNNSGKSSLIKAMLLFKANYEKTDLPDLDLTLANLNLGNFNEVFCHERKPQPNNLKFLIKSFTCFEISLNFEPDIWNDENLVLKDLTLFYNDRSFSTRGDNMRKIFSIEFNDKTPNQVVLHYKFDVDYNFFLKEFKSIIKDDKGSLSKKFEDRLNNLNKIDYEHINFIWSRDVVEYFFKKNITIKNLSIPLYTNYDLWSWPTEYGFIRDKSIINFFYFACGFTNFKTIDYGDKPFFFNFTRLLLFAATNQKLLIDDLGQIDSDIVVEIIEVFEKYKIEELYIFISECLNLIFQNLRINQDFVYYLPSWRSNPNRIFTDNSYDTFNEVLKDFRLLDPLNDPDIKRFLKKWLKKFDIGSNLKINRIPGYGTELIVTRHDKVDLTKLGFGISQVLTIILKVCNINARVSSKILHREEFDSCLIIEEPESHLHPALQSKLADFFVDAYKSFGTHFILETHSEYLIRKLQYMIAKKEIKKEDVAIYYFGPDCTKQDYITKIEIDDKGFMLNDFGPGFFDEAAKWISELWNMPREN